MVNDSLYVFVGGVFSFNDVYLSLASVREVFNDFTLCVESMFDRTDTGQSLYCNPPWSLAIDYVEHLRAFPSKSPMDTRTVVVRTDWPKSKAITKLK